MFRGAHAVVAVYDIRKKASYLKALQYINEVTNQAMPPLVVALVGNKQDLDSEREVAYNSAFKYAAERNVLYLETSAKTNTNVDQLFETVSEKLVEECLRRKVESDSRKRLRLSGAQTIDPTKKCCSIK